MNSPSSRQRKLHPRSMWRSRLMALYWVSTRILRRSAVDAVGQGEVDDPVEPAERHGRLGPVAGEGLQPGPLPPGQDDGQNVAIHQLRLRSPLARSGRSQRHLHCAARGRPIQRGRAPPTSCRLGDGSGSVPRQDSSTARGSLGPVTTAVTPGDRAPISIPCPRRATPGDDALTRRRPSPRRLAPSRRGLDRPLRPLPRPGRRPAQGTADRQRRQPGREGRPRLPLRLAGAGRRLLQPHQPLQPPDPGLRLRDARPTSAPSPGRTASTATRRRSRPSTASCPRTPSTPTPSTPTRATSTGSRATPSPGGPSTSSSSGSTAWTGRRPRPPRSPRRARSTPRARARA